MALEKFEDYAEENLEGKSSVGKTNVGLDSRIIDDFKERVKVSTNKDVAPVIEAVLLEELGLEDEAEEKMKEFQENVA